VRSITLFVNGRRVRTIRRDRARTTVSLRGLPKGTVYVRAIIRATRHGRRITVRDARTYRTCTPKSRRARR
jgi:hypothetical protein